MSSSPGWKPYAVVGIAVVAVAAAGWSIYSFSGAGRGEIVSADRAARDGDGSSGGPGARGGEEEVVEGEPGDGDRKRMVASDGPVPDWIMDAEEFRDQPDGGWQLPAYRSTDEAATAIENGLFGLEQRLIDDDGLGSVTLPQRSSLVRTWRDFVQPLVARDADTFRAAVERMGIAEDPENPGEHALAADLYATLVESFGGGTLGTAHTRARTPNAEDPRAIPRMPSMPGMDFRGIAAMRMRTENRDDATGTTTTSDAVMIPLQSVFPDAGEAADAGGRVVEVVSPVRLHNNKTATPDVVASVFFAYHSGNGAWHPLAVRLVLLTERALDAQPGPGGRG